MTSPAGEDLGALWRASKQSLDDALAAYRADLERLLRPSVTERMITGRVKSGRSVVRKIHEQAEAFPTWDSVRDKVGLRVICSTKADCHTVWGLLRNELHVVREEEKTGEYDRLFYPGIHLDVENPDVKDFRSLVVPAEVQVRTRAQDAWAVVSHKFLYKPGIPSPPKVNRMIQRLVVVMEMFDDDVQLASELRQQHRKEDPMLDTMLHAENLEEVYQNLTDEPAIIGDHAILEQLLTAYEPADRDRVSTLVNSYVSGARFEVIALLERHQPDSPAFDEARDWLYCTPEVLIVLERARSAHWMLYEAVNRTAIESAVRNVCASASLPLPGEE